MNFNTETTFEAKKPGFENTSKVRLTESSQPKLRFDHNKSKVDVHVISEQGKERTLPMVAKRLDKIETAESFSIYWSELVSAEINTIPTVRIIGKNEVLMTDLTADGSAFYGKDFVSLSSDRFRIRELSDLDKIFLSIDPEEIKSEALIMAEKANKAGIYLPFDDPFDVLVHPDGTWEVMVLDLMPSVFSPIIEKNNQICVELLLAHVWTIRQGLTGKAEKPMVVR